MHEEGWTRRLTGAVFVCRKIPRNNLNVGTSVKE